MERFWEQPWGQQPHFNAPAFATTPERAQHLLPCPLLVPRDDSLPEGLGLSELRVQPEGQTTHSAVTLTYAGAHRRLLLHQFFYDWWRPTDLTIGLSRALGHWRSGNQVVAWGRNHRGRYATVTGWGRTTVQLTVEEGSFVEWELRQLLGSLHPARPDLLPLLIEPAFHHLSCHVRRGHGPHGLDELAAAEWHTDPRTPLPCPVLLPDPMPEGWRLDAVARWPSPPPQETQWLLRDPLGQIVLYARARPSDDEQPLKLPATYRIQEGWQARQTMVRRRRTTLATQHQGSGGWSAAWAEEGHRYQLWLRAGTLPSERAGRAFVESLTVA